MTGNGLLGTVTFQALAPGSAQIGLAKANFTGRGGERLQVSPFSAVVEVVKP